MNFFKSIFKRNQIIVFTIGLMIITAGYLSYVNNNKETEGITASSIADSEEMASIGDAKLVSANVAESANSINSNTITEEADNNSEYKTSSLMDNYISSYMKHLWMLNQMNIK